MVELYEVWHYKLRAGEMPDKEDARQDAKLLGDYTSPAKAEAVIAKRSEEEGFRDWPLGFRIEEVPVDKGLSMRADGPISRYFRLWHFRIGPNDDDDSDDPAQGATQIGVFSSDQNARAAIERLRQDSRFRAFPDGFRVSSGPVDVEYWAGGFIPWDEA